jgi:hypothetical protein
MTNPESNRIQHVLKDRWFSAIKSALGKKHSVDCILLLYLGKGRHKDAMLFMENLGVPFSDGAYYARLKELTKLGLAKQIPIDAHRNYYTKTELCEEVAKLLIGFFETLAE